MADSPRPLADVLTYLDGIGYDGLYLAPSAAAQDRPLPTVESVKPAAAAPRVTVPPEPVPAPEPVSPAVATARAPETAASRIETPPPPKEPTQQIPSPNAQADQAAATSEAPVSTGELPTGDLAGEQRWQRLTQIEAQVRECTACGLCRGRQNTVFGSGNLEADLMLIGEGPGAEEDRKGLPFVGPAGALLTRIIEAIDLRREDVYIANMVKCRPPNNRDPLPEEVDACRGYLHEQIALVRPKVIVALGRVAAQALLESNDTLGRLRGRWHDVRGVATRATYHPAALLRYTKYKRPTWEDMKVVRDRLQASRG